jgi:hypothetical protein
MVAARSFTSFESPADLIGNAAPKGTARQRATLGRMPRKRPLRRAGTVVTANAVRTLAAAAVLALAAAGVAGFADLLPDRMADVSRSVEEIRGRRFSRPVPASEIDPAEARRVLRAKILDGLPAPPDETFGSLAAIGLIEDSPKLLDAVLDFYATQVVAFYDPDTRRFFVVRGAEAVAGADSEELAQGLIFSHELTHALQDEHLRLADRVKALKEDGDRSLALQCLLEGEATLVMIRVALREIPGASEEVEDQMAPLLTVGALERGSVSADVPEFFVDQLFFPYAEGTAFVRAAVKKGGWAEIDRLWRNPPESTSEILHGAPYPPPARNLLPSNVATLAPGQRLSYTDTLGEWTIRFLLGRSLTDEEASAGASGWRGDRIAYFVSGSERKMGYLWKLRFESAAAAARFETALRKAREKRPVAAPETIRRDGTDVVVSGGMPEKA